MDVPGGWYPACWSARLRRGALRALTLAGEDLALARLADGTPVVLEDRCPHRNAPLSAGRVVGTTVECGYHGWRFDAGGACVAIPGLASSEAPASRGRAVPAGRARDAHGLTWIALGDAPAEPPRPAHLGDEGWTTVRFDALVGASLADVVENVLDVPHTAFLHGGLFRRDSARRQIEIVVRRSERSAEAEFLGEPPPSGLIGRLLAPGAREVMHVDRFAMPNVAEVIYGLGAERGIHATHLFAPVDETTTRQFSIVCLRLRGGPLLVPVVRLAGRRILAQDVRMLEAQQRVVGRRGGARHASTELDLLGAHIRQLLRGVGGAEAERRVSMML